MITLSLLTFLLTGASALVDEGHQHDWQLIIGTDGGELWTDENWVGSFEQDSITYPLRLFRMKNVQDEDITEVHLRFAFDCPNHQLGIQATSYIVLETGELQSTKLDTVTFDFIEGSPSNEDELVLQTVCGEEPAP